MWYFESSRAEFYFWIGSKHLQIQNFQLEACCENSFPAPEAWQGLQWTGSECVLCGEAVRSAQQLLRGICFPFLLLPDDDDDDDFWLSWNQALVVFHCISVTRSLCFWYQTLKTRLVKELFWELSFQMMTPQSLQLRPGHHLGPAGAVDKQAPGHWFLWTPSRCLFQEGC